VFIPPQPTGSQKLPLRSIAVREFEATAPPTHGQDAADTQV
jgi:hypothetical protein